MFPRTERARITWIRYQGTEMLFLDFSDAQVEVSLDLIGGFMNALADREDGSVLLLTNVTDAHYDPAISAKWKTARLAREPKIKASAVFGLSGLVGMAIRGFMEAALLMGRPLQGDQLRIFKTEIEAKDWLSKK